MRRYVVDANGSLLLKTSLGIVKEQAPFAYQNANGRQVEVRAQYQVTGNSAYALSCEAFDVTKEMVIDPLVSCSYLGGSWDDAGRTVTVDRDGNIIVGGEAYSDDFRTTPGAYQTTSPGGAFVAKFTPSADSLFFSTYLATSSGVPLLTAAACDSTGALYVGGTLDHVAGFPLTQDAFDSVNDGANGYEGFLTRFAPDGASLEFSSFIGGMSFDQVYDIQVAPDGLVYLCGATCSADFPITPDALYRTIAQDGHGHIFLSEFDPSRSSLTYSTFIPGSNDEEAHVMSIAGPRRLWIGGESNSADFPITEDAFQPTLRSTWGNAVFLLIDLNANALLYSSFLGGSGRTNMGEWLYGISVVDTSVIVLAGSTWSMDFPITSGVFDSVRTDTDSWMAEGFVTVLRLPDSLIASSFIGGVGVDNAIGVHADRDHITVVGQTASNDFPVTQGAYDTLLNGNGQPAAYNWSDLFISRLSFDLRHLEYSTLFGGSGMDHTMAVHFVECDTVLVTGETSSADLPVSENAVQPTDHGYMDAFLLKFAMPPDSQSTARPAVRPNC